MPVDLFPAGSPSAYPARMRFLPWACTWLICNVFGPVIVLLAWPKDEPANGPAFWIWVVAAPSGLFAVLLGFARAGYEVLWYRAYWRNHHRDRWLAEKIRIAQRPLHVLGAGYCLPLGGKTLTDVLAGKRSILKAQPPRQSSGRVLCNRFEDTDERLAASPVTSDEGDGNGEAAKQTKVDPAVQMIRVALEPLSAALFALTRYESAYWPRVQVLVEPEIAVLRLTQVRDALRLAALPPLEVQAAQACDGLLVLDAWLDARNSRPLLVIAAAWYDDAIEEGRAEGCAALLLDAGYFKLPPEVSKKATLHRPVAGEATEPEHGLANAAVWGKADASAVTRAWITRPIESCGRALRAAGFDAASKDPAQCQLDRIIGDAAAANGLLSIAAAIEANANDGPQLIIDGVQSAILYVLPADQATPKHDESQRQSAEHQT